MCNPNCSNGTTTSGTSTVSQPSKTSTTWKIESQSPWQCYQCNLMNSSLAANCQGCFLSKFHSTFDLSSGYTNLSDNDLAAIILNSNRDQLRDIHRSLELHAALLFNKGFKFALNHRSESERTNGSDLESTLDPALFVEDRQILPLSMAFEREEIYLIKLLLKKGANPNQWTKPQHLKLHHEWFDLSRYAVYVHFLPISIPIRKYNHYDNGQASLTEYKEIYDLLIHYGALWVVDRFKARFSGQDPSFWVDFLSSYHFRRERQLLLSSMQNHYEKCVKPQIVKSVLGPVESVLAEYLVSFPMIDTEDIAPILMAPMDEGKSESSDSGEGWTDGLEVQLDFCEPVDVCHSPGSWMGRGKVGGFHAKILSMKRVEDTLCPQIEYTVIDEFAVMISLLIYDERIYRNIEVGDVIYVGDATVICNEGTSKLVHSLMRTPSISVIFDPEIKDRFESIC